jgi:sugar phosphate isomerase/epimerase
VTSLRFGYNSNGFAHHRPLDALSILLEELEYEGVALTIDHTLLDPFDPSLRKRQLPPVKRLIHRFREACTVETGARFLLDPLHKHQPTLISHGAKGRGERLDFLRKAVDISAELEVPVVSFWSGTPDRKTPDEKLWAWLVEGCRALAEHAATKNVRLAFEPEPGMFIDTMTKFGELHRRVDHSAFGLTLDIGLLHCQGETPIADHVRKWSHVLWNVHIEDMRRGVHDHLMFGEGEIDFPPVLRALREVEYTGGIHVELSRHSHNAVETARRALEFLRVKSRG